MDSTLYPGKAYIYRDPELYSMFPDDDDDHCEDDDTDYCEPARTKFLDVNAQEFIPSPPVGQTERISQKVSCLSQNFSSLSR